MYVYTHTHTHTHTHTCTHTHTHRGILLSHKKNEIMPFSATRMDLEIIILHEVSQKEKNKYHMISLICGIKNMTQTNPYSLITQLVNNLPAIKEILA